MTPKKLSELQHIFGLGGILNHNDFRMLLNIAIDHLKLVNENKRLRKALDYYASIERGSIARKALEVEE